jgi:tripartite-type tricarboxylate transporter receptor subunit TctC
MLRQFTIGRIRAPSIPIARIASVVSISLSLTVATLFAPAEPFYPNRPVRIITPYGPGGIADVTMRTIAQKLSKRLGQQFIVDNRPGAGGIIAAKAAIRYFRSGTAAL